MFSVPGSGHLVAGRYRLLDQLGRGAMGIVWRGRDELLDRDVAVKQIVLTPMASATEAQASYQRTLREARTAARLSHPGVVTVFDVVEEDGTPWIVMELVVARPLDQVIAEDGPLPPAEAAQLGLSLLDALATAHAAGVLHRDVKPSNVLISPAGQAILTDFGIATIQGDPGLTQAGMVVGTPGFSPPERVRGAPASTASDLWSLGATLYAAVEGRGPFDRAGGSMAIVASIATEPAPRAPSAGPLAPVIDTLLRADPAERPDATATARMLTQALEAARSPGAASWIFAPPAPRQGGNGAALPPDPVVGPAAAGPAAAGLAAAGLAAASADERSGPAPRGPDLAAASLDATTATQFVGVPSRTEQAAALLTAPSYQGIDGELAGVTAALGQADRPADQPSAGAGLIEASALPGTTAAPDGGAAVEVVPDLMATPVFADLKMPAAMPGTALFDVDPGAAATSLPAAAGATPGAEQPAASTDQAGAAGGAGAQGRAGDPPAAGGNGGRDSGDRPRSRRGLVLLAPLAVSALVIGIVFLAFPSVGDSLMHGLSRLPGSSAVGSGSTTDPSVTSPPRHSRPGSSAHSHPGSGTPAPGSSHQGSPGPTPSGTRHHSGKPAPSGSPTPSKSPSSSGSPTPSTSPTPSPSPSQSAASLPPGFAWQSESAATAGSTAGFRMAVRANWAMTPGLDTVFKPPAGGARQGVDMTPFTYDWPLRQAKLLQKQAIAKHTFHNYHLVSLVAMHFHGSAAATWVFWWKPAKALHRVDVTEVLFRAKTPSGPQSYILSMAVPAPRASWALHIFRVGMRTFSPQP
jgi:tRNA A-37 threonylcarbamoyl transferase component Bud32